MPDMNVPAPFDAQFIDSMILHHKGALAMAQQALQETRRQEIRHIALAIVKTQQQEMNQMEQWRKLWYPGLAPTQGMRMPVGDMQISTATHQPFDMRFIDAMVSHHQAAMAMAQVAQRSAEHAQVKHLATAIIRTQQSEETQFKQWRHHWYPGQP